MVEVQTVDKTTPRGAEKKATMDTGDKLTHLQKLLDFLIKKVFLKGYYGEVQITVEDGMPTRWSKKETFVAKLVDSTTE